MPRYNFDAVRQYFEENSEETRLIWTTEFGNFAPSPLPQLERVVGLLFNEGVLPEHGNFLDAGHGDGRVVHLFHSFGYGSYGAEGDRKLFEISVRHFGKLKSKKKIFFRPPDESSDPSILRLAHGDFTDNSTYTSLDLPFLDLNVIFNYQSNEYALASMIKDYGSEGTIFLLAYHSSAPPSFESMEHLKTLPLFDGRGEAELTAGCFLHVYKKNPVMYEADTKRRAVHLWA